MPDSIIFATGGSFTGAPPAVQLLKLSRQLSGSQGIVAGTERTAVSTGMSAKVTAGSTTIALARVSGRLTARFIADQPPMETPSRFTSGSGSCTSAWCSHRARSEEHTSELQSRGHLVCRLLLERKKLNQ